MSALLPRLRSVTIRGFRPFGDFHAEFGPLEVIVGANGSGKSSLFDFLRFLRDAMERPIPPPILPGYVGQRVFHVPGPEEFSWEIEAALEDAVGVVYDGKVVGPVGAPKVKIENVRSLAPLSDQEEHPYTFLTSKNGNTTIEDPEPRGLRARYAGLPLNRLVLGGLSYPEISALYSLHDYISRWRFYSSFAISGEAIRRPSLIEQEPVLAEDASNLSAVLHYLLTEHRSVFEELQEHIHLLVPEFKSLKVKARGAPGEVIAFWEEEGGADELTVSDLSDGILRLLCWTVLCLQPNPPPLICIDEPDQGVHPRTLPVLAGLFEKACDRTQIILATHASYFLTQFDISRIAVMKKEDGQAVFAKPVTSKALRENLKDFGAEEIEVLHRSDELERLA